MKEEHEALVQNAADEGQVKNAKQVEKTRKTQEQIDMVFLLGLPAFRRFAWNVLENAHVFSTTWDGVSVENTLFREGERNSGIKLLSQIMAANPQRFIEMMQECKGEKNNGKRNSDGDTPNADA